MGQLNNIKSNHTVYCYIHYVNYIQYRFDDTLIVRCGNQKTRWQNSNDTLI